MNKIFYGTILTFLLLNLEANNLSLKKIPIEKKFLSVENGGEKHAIDVYSDGVGIYTNGLGDKRINAMNNLVFDFGIQAKQENLSLKEYVQNNGTIEQKALASLLSSPMLITTNIGDICNDGDPSTYNDIYIDTNGTCLGSLNSSPSSLSISDLSSFIIGETKNIIFNAIDQDNDNLSFSYEIYNVSLNNILVDSGNLNSNKNISLNIVSPIFIENNQYKIKLIVSDGKSISTLDSSVIDITSQPSKIVALPNGTITCPTATIRTTEIYNGLEYYIAGSKTDLANKMKGSNGILDNGGDDFPAERICTTHLTDFDYLFTKYADPAADPNKYYLGTINNIYHIISNWDTSNITSLTYTFANTAQFNQDINNWDTKNVLNLNHTFSSTSLFNMPLNNWNISKVTSMYMTFSYASAFNQNLNTWDFSKVVNMMGTFRYTNNFNNGCPISTTTCSTNWNVSNVTSMEQTFSFTKAFNQSLSTWNVTKVGTMANMFYGASKFNLPLSTWNVSNVTNMQSMFRSSTTFKQSLTSWNVTKVTVWAYFYLDSVLNGTLIPSKFR